MRALKEILRLLDQYNAYDRVVLASFHEELYVEYKRLVKEGEVPENFMFSPAIYVFACSMILSSIPSLFEIAKALDLPGTPIKSL